MFSKYCILLTLFLLRTALAVPAPAFSYVTSTSTRATTIVSCSCTSTSKSGSHINTVTFSASASCTSKKIQPTCKTTTSSITSVVISTKTFTSFTSTKPTSSTATSNPTSSSTAKPATTSSSSQASTSSTTKVSTTSSSTTPTPTKSTGKRGLSYNDPSLTAPFSLSGQSSKVSWSYNWYSFPYTIGQTQSGYNPALQFVPMLWSNASVLTSVWTANVHASIADYGTTAVVAFNEPDGCGGGGSCMSLNDSVVTYQEYMNPLAGTVRLGAPAVTNGGGSMGLTYLQSFLNQCTGCHIDFVPVHWYGDAGNSSGFEWYIGQAYAVAGNRPLWVTEFGTTSGTAEQSQAFLQTVMVWMDASPMVERYAWFMDSVGNEINANGTGLSELGSMYNSG